MEEHFFCWKICRFLSFFSNPNIAFIEPPRTAALSEPRTYTYTFFSSTCKKGLILNIYMQNRWISIVLSSPRVFILFSTITICNIHSVVSVFVVNEKIIDQKNKEIGFLSNFIIIQWKKYVTTRYAWRTKVTYVELHCVYIQTITKWHLFHLFLGFTISNENPNGPGNVRFYRFTVYQQQKLIECTFQLDQFSNEVHFSIFIGTFALDCVVNGRLTLLWRDRFVRK